MPNPGRNAALLLEFDYLSRSASARLNRVELIELLRSTVTQEIEFRCAARYGKQLPILAIITTLALGSPVYQPRAEPLLE